MSSLEGVPPAHSQGAPWECVGATRVVTPVRGGWLKGKVGGGRGGGMVCTLKLGDF